MKRCTTPAMSERQLEDAVIECARLLGWRVTHFRPAVLPSGKWATHLSGDMGFPDLVLARRGRLAFVELKSETGRPSVAQIVWLNVLSSFDGADVCLWRPSDWTSGAIERGLGRCAPMPGRWPC